MELIVENIRSFVGRHEIAIKPLTLLVGENSAGKTTLMALLSAVRDPFGFPFRPGFNTPPYTLGNYDTLATNLEGNGNAAPSFRLGNKGDVYSEVSGIATTAEYVNDNGTFQVCGIQISMGAFNTTLRFETDAKRTRMIFSLDFHGKKYGPYSEELKYNIPLNQSKIQLDDIWFLMRDSLAIAQDLGENVLRSFLNWGYGPYVFHASLAQTLSLSPMRMKPKRTYDIISEEFSPEGDHIPFVLPSLLNNPERRQMLEDYGAESGLFRKVEVRRLGEYNTDPARVMVTGSGAPANLIDTGYGVGQALPVVVESIRAANGTMLLLQQPEVHLHPRAQAALATLFTRLIKAENKQFVVETHSDYIIDRVRIEVAKGNIAAEDVAILYFEKPDNATRIYPLTLDSSGNILNAPPTYRDFFLREAWDLLSGGGK